MHVNDDMCGFVYITDSPISDAEIAKNNVIKVKTEDPSVAKAYYNEKSNSITIEAISAGSTEIEVYIQKNKTSGRLFNIPKRLARKGDSFYQIITIVLDFDGEEHRCFVLV